MKHKRPTNRAGLQGFHGRDITLPRRPADRSDPRRFEHISGTPRDENMFRTS